MPTGQAVPTPLDALWQARVIMWVLVACEVLAIVLSLAPGIQGDRWIHFALSSVFIQWVALVALSGLYGLRAWLSRLRPTYVAYATLVLILLSTWLVTTGALLMVRDMMPVSRDDWPEVYARFSAIALSVGLLGLAAFQNHWRARQLAVLAKQSELEALQARIRPHFLFNTLNTGAALVHLRPAQAERLLLDLADLFRAALGGPRELPLHGELDLTRLYLEVESLRFGDRLRMAWMLPDPLPDVMVPTLSIQPLVENAIKHGIEKLAEGGLVEVQVVADTAKVTISVSSPLAPSQASSHRGHSVGLSSVRARVEALTQGRGKVTTASAGDRFTSTIELPLRD